MSDKQTREITDILDHQNLSFVKGDVDEIMKDFSKQSMLFTPNGVLEGIDSIRKFYTDTIANFVPPGSDFNITRQEVRGQTATLSGLPNQKIIVFLWELIRFLLKMERFSSKHLQQKLSQKTLENLFSVLPINYYLIS